VKLLNPQSFPFVHANSVLMRPHYGGEFVMKNGRYALRRFVATVR
jgi:hypothetical protein